MILKFTNDVPKQLIDILKRCNFSQIPESQHAEKLEQIRALAMKYMVRKTHTNYPMIEHEVKDCPKQLANLINQMDFNKINKVKQLAAATIIKKYLSEIHIYQ